VCAGRDEPIWDVIYIYIYTWKCHNETYCLKQKKTEISFFFKNEGQTSKMVLSGDWYQLDRGGYKEGVKDGAYDGNTMYSCMKMKNETC
jgi:hypothetical protein